MNIGIAIVIVLEFQIFIGIDRYLSGLLLGKKKKLMDCWGIPDKTDFN
jgi:hypothetical protein